MQRQIECLTCKPWSRRVFVVCLSILWFLPSAFPPSYILLFVQEDIIFDILSSKSLPKYYADQIQVSPPARGLIAKQVPESGDTINGLFIPGGVASGGALLGYSLMRRFSEKMLLAFVRSDGSTVRPRSLNSETRPWIFYHGKWQCLGKNLALMELNKVFVEVGSHIWLGKVMHANHRAALEEIRI